MSISERQEWLEADGLGGFASGTATGVRTRRYHALLLAAATPPTGRQVLVAGLEGFVETGGSRLAISSHRYVPDVIHPDGALRLESFSIGPWPCWRYRLSDTVAVEHSLFVPKGLPLTVLRWRVAATNPDGVAAPLLLEVRPLLAGRDYHSTHHENGAFRFDPVIDDDVMRWAPYEGVQSVLARSNGAYTPQPDWYRNFLYVEERDRGLDAVEDLASPGTFNWDLSAGDAVLILAADTAPVRQVIAMGGADRVATDLAVSEKQRRGGFQDQLARSADAYIVRRGTGATIVAGYPWFTDWGRDTFIALRGLGLATERYTEARQILLEWAGAVSEGMLPNRFPDAGESPEFNAVDASLWYIVAAHEWLTGDPTASADDRTRIQQAIEAILDGYSRGTRFGIRADDDGLLAAGVPGVQLTWMDARIGDRVVTPRIGKPVEVQALWINALWVGSHFSARWNEPLRRALETFEARFWNEEAGALYDVIDVNHERGVVDDSFRPNQILAIGGLPHSIVDGERAARIVRAVEERLYTPLGLRSLAPDDPAYVGRYSGGVESRDGAYHQGTVWPWLMGPFVEAWVRTHGDTAAARQQARARFLDPLLAGLEVSGVGHLPEVLDGDAPHRPGGCPFQAWSLGEALRLDRVVLGRAPKPGTNAARRHRRVETI